jgi:hypothetical protein
MENNAFQTYITALINNNNTFEILKNKYTEILADLVSSKTNPNCSCRGRIGAFFTKKYNESPEDKAFLDELFHKPEIIESYERIIRTTPQRPAAPRSISGKIFRIPKTDEGWEALNKDIAGSYFKSFNILEKEDHLEVYFL